MKHSQIHKILCLDAPSGNLGAALAIRPAPFGVTHFLAVVAEIHCSGQPYDDETRHSPWHKNLEQVLSRFLEAF